jgi:NAD-dependent DNA ligase
MSTAAFSLPPNPEALGQPEFSTLLDNLEDAYFNEEELVPNSVYDELLALYVKRFGPRGKVGAPIRNMENKRVLERPMPSLDKVKTEHELNLWKKRNPGPYVISAKVDGISMQHHRKQLSTRGTGMVGGIVDSRLTDLKMPPDAGTSYVRAENVMPISLFTQKYEKEFVNPRNMVGGLLNPASTSWKSEQVRDLLVLAYEFASEEPMRPSDQFMELDKRGYRYPRYITGDNSDDLTVELLKELLEEWRREEDYEMDGLVIARDEPYPHPLNDDLPDHAIAFKMAGESALTTVEEVQWNASKHGLLKPRVRIKPVVLDGVTITWATGHNAKFIDDNGIAPGREVEVERSGAVIPYIKGVPNPRPGEGSMPPVYAWLKRKKMAPLGANKVPEDAVLEEVDGEQYHVWYVESDVDICTVGETGEQRIKFLAEFFKKLGCKHVGEATITKLYQAGHETLSSFFRMTVDDVKKVQGFQDKSATRVIEAIRDGIANVPLARLAGASGVFGAGFGERKISAVIQKLPNILELDLPFGEMCELLHSAGLQTTAPQFTERLPFFKRWLREHPQVTVSYVPTSSPASASSVMNPSTSGPLEWPADVVLNAGKAVSHSSVPVTKIAIAPAPEITLAGESLSAETIVLSGFRSKELEDAITARGGRVTSAISGKTTILVVKTLGTGKGKEAKASEMGIRVLDLASFKQQYGC